MPAGHARLGKWIQPMLAHDNIQRSYSNKIQIIYFVELLYIQLGSFANMKEKSRDSGFYEIWRVSSLPVIRIIFCCG